MEMYRVLLIYLEIFNLLAFAAMGLDKLLARRELRRIPEATLLGLAVMGGSVGALAGMYCFRHKTRKPRFTVGLPMILAAQLVFFLLVIWAVGL